MWRPGGAFFVYKEVDMLVLTRRVGEEIVIDEIIRIQVVDVRGDRVRLGISAPASVQVDRKELHERRMEFSPIFSAVEP